MTPFFFSPVMNGSRGIGEIARPHSATSAHQDEEMAAGAGNHDHGDDNKGGATPKNNNDNNQSVGTPPSGSASSPPLRILRLHNLPRNWLHDDILQFIDQAAASFGIEPPPPASTSHSSDHRHHQEEEGGDATGIPRTTSPFVHHLTVFFGRRTGIVFGSPRLVLTSPALCDALLRGVPLEPDDYRSRIYFTEEKEEQQQQEQGDTAPHEGKGRTTMRKPYSSPLVALEESLEEEQRLALEHLELDRYLFSPDLLYDIQRLHQRRFITQREAVLLDSFTDGKEDESMGQGESEGEDADNDGAAPSRSEGRRGIKKKKLKKGVRWRLAAAQKHLGRGSMQNMPIPKPYVQGRRV